jgi:hypothetical protein
VKILNVSCDKLTFVGGISDKRLLNDLQFNPFVKGQSRAKFPYDYTWYMQDGSVLQLASPTGDVRPLRYEFNPNHWKENDHKLHANGQQMNNDYHIMSVLRCIKNVELTRNDIAIDVQGPNLGKYTWVDMKARKGRTHHDGQGNIETRYIGSERSTTMFRIYNKTIERKDKGSIARYADWWRVEVQLRGEDAKNYLTVNPFKEIMCIKKNGVGASGELYDLKTKAMLHYLSCFPEAINEIPSNSTKTKYRQLLAATSEQISETSFSQIYEDNLDKIRETVDTFKNLTAMNWNFDAKNQEDLEFNEQLKKEIMALDHDQE